MKNNSRNDFEDLLAAIFSAIDECGDFAELDKDLEHDQFGLRETIENIVDESRMYYNSSKSTFTIVDTIDTTNKAVVKKHPEDKEDIEKAMLYCLFKYLGVSPAFLNKQLKKVHMQDKAEK